MPPAVQFTMQATRTDPTPCLHPPHRRYQEETRKAIESINAVMSHLGAAAVDLLTDTNKLLMLVAGGSALALGVYGAREGARVAGKAAERWLGTPKLVRETSRLALIRGPQNLLPAAAKKTLDQVGGVGWRGLAREW